MERRAQQIAISPSFFSNPGWNFVSVIPCEIGNLWQQKSQILHSVVAICYIMTFVTNVKNQFNFVAFSIVF